MPWWQVRADLGPALLMFGVQAADRETARARAADLIGDRTALVEVTEVPRILDRPIV